VALEDSQSPMDAALAAAGKAVIPESSFPVGCVLETAGGKLIPGCNIETDDWTLGLCAERVAISSALAYGHTHFSRIYLTCPKDENATPCGACRQVLFEFGPGLEIIMSRGGGWTETSTAEDLLPGGFRGEHLRV
ncbi:MAG: cytidine deaminase, partial [Rubricoccaceae bacterium]|nr:cytidine deaminase [Rubricoccaceae bacterium]